MRFDILSILPGVLASPLQEGIISRAIKATKAEIEIHNIRDFTTDKHSTTDDRPYGGGEGMVLKVEPIAATLEHVTRLHGPGRVIMLSPQGPVYTQKKAEQLAELDHLILLCGRYEGVDSRAVELFVDEELSIGDFILTGGELAAMILVDSIIRLLPGVLGCADSAVHDTFSRNLLKHPQYTRPRTYDGLEVPEVLLTGDHQAISDWRFLASVRQTLQRRPELFRVVEFSQAEKKLLSRHGLLGEIERLVLKGEE
ncbi:MAG: tRNA (guanosine(37)-N1)-methyltransferase TrmD [Proteobacteria bacterium]|nr:tRNA (guanosine(37)-N1)-methyltransferase TrmD [Pseudomonadota bacterium]MBU1687273.1 tRNA (guanosine(37)-N1)-methyltransferase TrmD [Pseudomonadota bacterium]